VSDRDETFTIDKTLPRVRLDAFLRERYPAISRGTIQRLLEQGDIRVDGRVVKPTHAPRAGEVISVHWPQAIPAVAQPEAIAIDVIYEDPDIIVVNKVPGIVVHPAAGNEAGTLVNALLHHCKGELSGVGGVQRPGIVHRLDKDTSGCLIVAKHDAAHLSLTRQFAGRDVRKIYEAILCGILPHRSGNIRVPIARHPSHRKRMAAVQGGRDAWTSFKVLQFLKGSTHVAAELHTGRTHQIRVHFQHLGFPILGDSTYGQRQSTRLRELTGYAAPRQMLHARTIEISHPSSGNRLRFEAPLPDDFAQAICRLNVSGA
jgi:23S rRNA pseudouridine1911/1915/1917 synthase